MNGTTAAVFILLLVDINNVNKGRDIRVVEGARLESDSGQLHQPTHLKQHQGVARQALPPTTMSFGMRRYTSMFDRAFEGYLTQFCHNADVHFAARQASSEAGLADYAPRSVVGRVADWAPVGDADEFNL